MLVFLSMAVSRLFIALFAPLHRRLFPPPQKYTLNQLLKAYCETLDPGPCPGFSALEAYRDDELSPQAVETMQEHLSLCCDCTQLYLDFVFPVKNCPTWQELEQYKAGTIPQSRRAQARAHIDDCPACHHFYLDLILPGITPLEYIQEAEKKASPRRIKAFLAEYDH